ncbi:MFS transporter [Zymomonas mobilis]|uniref:MFS transporter n=1 Tax=Zymomonas mobilis TaxID=542 RepID=UPI0021C37C64|nr:MFS transporter [Zymomonas mobilis]MCP9308489.1 MFS transporter [Zymomonas mobilis]
MKNRPSPIGGAILAILIGLNLRPIMASISPLLKILQSDLTLDSRQASLLTTFPVMMMGLFALAGAWLQRRMGEKKGIAVGLLLIALASLNRFYTNSATTLIVTAAIGGIGIALAQALMPAFLKRRYPDKAGSLLGLFTTGIMGGAALSSALSVPLANLFGWRQSLALAAIPAIIACAFWVIFAHNPNKPSALTRLPFKNRRAWLLMAFFGIGTGAYTLVLAWLPPYYVELGWPASYAGYLLGILTLTEVVAGLLVSSLIHHFPDRRIPLTLVILLTLLGLGCLITTPLSLAFPATILLGLGIGALFPLSLIVALDHTHSPKEAGSLLAFVQGGGYLIASFMPFFAGILRDEMASLRLAWAGMAVGIALLLILCRSFSPQRNHL